MANQGGRPTIEERRQQRHESRAQQTWRDFVEEVCSRSAIGVTDEAAEDAASSVLCHLQRRLTQDEAKDLESQLPSKLRALLADSCGQRRQPHKMHREEFVSCVAEDLGRAQDEAEVLVRAVFATVRLWISEGEANDVAAQLPRDLRPLWEQPS